MIEGLKCSEKHTKWTLIHRFDWGKKSDSPWMSCRIQPEELSKYNGDLTVDFFWGSIVSMLDELAGGDSARTESKMVSVSYHWCTQPLRSVQQNGLLLVPTGVEERLGPGLRKAFLAAFQGFLADCSKEKGFCSFLWNRKTFFQDQLYE